MTKRPHLPTGPIPKEWCPEAVGIDLRRAFVVLTQDIISQAVEETEVSILVDEDGRQREERGRRMPNGRHYMLMSEIEEHWWEATDIHTPALLGKLIRGELFAFGDPEVTGAPPVWISPRQWRQLRFDPLDIGQKVAGGGATFWNVRVVDQAALHKPEQGDPSVGTIELYRTGAAGRPGSMHLVRSEFERRLQGRELIRGGRPFKQVADDLAAWLRGAHPSAAPVTSKTIQNDLGADWRALPKRNASD